MTTLILFRGLSADRARRAEINELIEKAHTGYGLFFVHLNTHSFFNQSGAEVEFKSGLLGAAHDWVYGTAFMHLAAGRSVLVSNSFRTRKEIRRYFTGLQRSGLHKVRTTVIRAKSTVDCAGFEGWAGEIVR